MTDLTAKFLTVAEVATRVRVSKMTVYRLVHIGELKAIRVGRSLRIPETAVTAYLEHTQAHVLVPVVTTTHLGQKVIEEALSVVGEWDKNTEDFVSVDGLISAVHRYLEEQESIAETAEILDDPNVMAAIAEAEAER